jgi:hypothetical protein
MPALLEEKVIQVSQEYLIGYHAAKNIHEIFSPTHYIKYYTISDYRDGFTRGMINNFNERLSNDNLNSNVLFLNQRVSLRKNRNTPP